MLVTAIVFGTLSAGCAGNVARIARTTSAADGVGPGFALSVIGAALFGSVGGLFWWLA